MKRLLSIVLLLPVIISFAGDNVLPYWAIGGFTRPEGQKQGSTNVNPMVSPIAESLFYCPMKKANVRWECADTFNPAAVVKDGKDGSRAPS